MSENDAGDRHPEVDKAQRRREGGGERTCQEVQPRLKERWVQTIVGHNSKSTRGSGHQCIIPSGVGAIVAVAIFQEWD